MNKIYILPINTDAYRFIKEKAAKKFNIDINSLKIKRNKHRKPFFENLTDFHFNISHSGELMTIAVSSSPVGVDIEKIHDFNPKIINRFHQYEKDYINSKDTQNRFFEVWTKKESCLKYLGCGLAGGLDKFSVFDFSPSPITFKHNNYYISVCSQHNLELSFM